MLRSGAEWVFEIRRGFNTVDSGCDRVLSHEHGEGGGLRDVSFTIWRDLCVCFAHEGVVASAKVVVV